MPTGNNPSQKRYPPELRERAVRMVAEAIEAQGGDRHGVVTQVAHQLGVGVESLRSRVNQAEIDNGTRPGISTEERRRSSELEKEIPERWAGEVEAAASAQRCRNTTASVKGLSSSRSLSRALTSAPMKARSWGNALVETSTRPAWILPDAL